LRKVVGAAGFEPAASSSQGSRSTGLTYAPSPNLHVVTLFFVEGGTFLRRQVIALAVIVDIDPSDQRTIGSSGG
jgi:hypothetical protein